MLTQILQQSEIVNHLVILCFLSQPGIWCCRRYLCKDQGAMAETWTISAFCL